MAELTAAIEAAAHAISAYDWDNGISANGETSKHQRAEATAAITAAAPLIEASVRAKIAEEIARAIEARMVEVPSDDSNWDAWLSSGGWNAALGKAAAIARGHAGNRAEIDAAGTTGPDTYAEKVDGPEPAETLSGREVKP